jgi:hypothetical protein
VGRIYATIPRDASPSLLLCSATAVSAVSFSFGFLPELPELAMLGLFCLLGILGCLSMWLCWKAYQKAAHRRSVLLYAILLAPFAFSIPAWWIGIFAMMLSSHYSGPFP